CPSPAADVKAIRDELSRILGPQGTPSGPGLLNILTEYVVANTSADVKALREARGRTSPERKAEIEALASRMDGIISWPDAAPAIRELLAEVDRADASGYARGRAEAVEECYNTVPTTWLDPLLSGSDADPLVP